ncbi:MAG: glycosyltransferase family 4 protein [Candidatus Aenigmarchaeota archaeon]|nr:glycosyltransferase family 4 protein [Candidatus Aenigmarchaeota archaeon]
MNVNLIFDYPAKGFGTHTAFINHKRVMETIPVDFSVNRIFSKDFTHAHTIGPLSLLNATKRRNFIFTYHMTRYESSFLKLQSSIIPKVVNYVIKRSAAIVAPSPFCKQEINIKKPIAVISNGVDTERFKKSKKRRKEFRERYGIENDQILVYSIGMLTAKKGVMDFCRAANEMNDDIRFLWTGRSYSHVKCIKEELLKKKFPNVIFTGFADDIRDVHSAGDLMLYTSMHEILGIPILEAFSTGNPVILRDIPTFHGWLSHKKECMKFSDMKVIPSLIKEVTENHGLRRRIVSNAFLASKKHDIAGLGRYYEELYQSCQSGDLEAVNNINSYI